MAKTQPNPDPQPDRAAKFAVTYLANYNEVLALAEAAEETTRTPAWQSMYKAAMDTHANTVTANLKAIVGECDMVKTMDNSEAAEKAIKEAVKALTDERIRHAAWMLRTVHPISDLAERAGTIISNLTTAAGQEERDQPLLCRGLSGEVADIVETWTAVIWRPGSGELVTAKKSI